MKGLGPGKTKFYKVPHMCSTEGIEVYQEWSYRNV